MASAVDLVNLALSHLGAAAEVIDINPPDGSAEARYGARFYPMARDELLEQHPWSFATRRVALATIVSDRPMWAYAYALPSDCIRPLALLQAEAMDDDSSEDFIVESTAAGARAVYSNVPTPTLRYISLVQDTTKFTPGFASALSRLLASKLAGPIIKGTEGMQVSQAQLKIALIEVGNAKAADSNSGKREIYRDRVPDGLKARNFVVDRRFDRGVY